MHHYGQKYKFCEKSNKIEPVANALALYPHSDSDTLTERHFITNFFWGIGNFKIDNSDTNATLILILSILYVYTI